jgi:hypothetical protein
VIVLVVVVLFIRDGRQDVTPAPPAEAPRASPGQAAAALATFVEAVERRDRAALDQLAPADQPAARELLSGVAANVRSLDLSVVTARYVDQVGTVSAEGSWTGTAELTWRLRGFDQRPARSDVKVRFAPHGDGLGIVGFEAATEGGSRLPLWLRGELSVARAGDVLVAVDGSRRDALDVLGRAVRGSAVVRRVLPDWDGPVVVEVPVSGADLDETLGVEPGTYSGIAAVTAPVGDPDDVDGPVHVFVNPSVTDRLRRTGAQVVMSHELVHVATDAVRRPVEPWLLEGFADYVALRDTRLPDRITLGRAIEAARRDGVPDALPSAADFDRRSDDLQAHYEKAWLACRVIGERLGEKGLVDLYDDVRAGAPVRSALLARGLRTAEVTRVWRTRLVRLAG